MLLSAHGLSKHYGRNAVLRDAGFSVREGEVLGLIGPNGAGKTTLFECLAGLVPSDAGEGRFRGQPVPPARRKQALFYMPDGVRPWPDQTVAWALSFFESLDGGSAQSPALLTARIGSLSKGRLDS